MGVLFTQKNTLKTRTNGLAYPYFKYARFIELVSIPATHEPRAAAYQFGHRFSSSAIEVACAGQQAFLLLPQKCLLLSSCSHLLCCSNKWIFCNKKEQQIQDLRNFSTMNFDILLAISSITVLEFFSHRLP